MPSWPPELKTRALCHRTSLPFPAIECNQVGQDLISKPKVLCGILFPIAPVEDKGFEQTGCESHREHSPARDAGRMQGWIEGLGVWVLACVSIVPKRNKTQDKRTDTEIQPIAYPEGSHSFFGCEDLAFTIQRQ